MTTSFSFRRGSTPLLVSVPHDGRLLPAAVSNRMTAAGLALQDTDWHVGQLYDFVRDHGASILVADYSRYVVDLNRSASDEALYENQRSTGLCPEATFAGDSIYQPGKGVTAEERAARIAEYWRPYHSQLEHTLREIRDEFGFAILWDAHSIQGELPSLFSGRLPDLNIGTNDGASCPKSVVDAVLAVAAGSPYSVVLDGRFKGGYITRNYGAPARCIYALQLELAQRCYMDEASLRYDRELASELIATIENMLNACVDAATDASRRERVGT